MAKIDIYLTFDGNCEEAFNFYKSVFANEFLSFSRFSEMPPDPESNYYLSDEELNKVMHVALPVGEDSLLMGSDRATHMGLKYNRGNNFTISLNTKSKEEANRLFSGLSESGSVIQPMQDMFWGAYYGMFEDKFGINWMISFETSPHEDH